MIWNVYKWPRKGTAPEPRKAEWMGRMRAKHYPEVIKKAWRRFGTKDSRQAVLFTAHPKTADPFFR